MTKVCEEKSVMIKDENPYLKEYIFLEMDLSVLKEMNKRLPKSIQQIRKEQERKMKKKFKRLDDKTKEEFEKFFQLLEKNIRENKKLDIARLSISEKTGEFLVQATYAAMFPNRFSRFIRDMSLVYLIAEFESFLQKILELSFRRKPEVLSFCRKSMTFEELLKFEDINDVKQKIIEKEALSIINQDIEDISKYFEQRFSINISQFVNWKKFGERFYRRNILVHNSGMPNKLYRLKTGYKGKDERMVVSRNYLNESIKLFDKMAMKISESFRKKFG